MKKYIYSAVVTIALATLSTSCEKELDVQPTNAVAESYLYDNVDNVETVINGTWRYMMDTYFTYANPGYGAILRASDAMGDDVAVTTKYGFRDAYAFNEVHDFTKTRVTGFWTLLYKVINNANNVIAKVDAAKGSETKKRQLKGQALALRANSYLTLATYYQFTYLKDPNAKAVPIYTTPTDENTKGNPKATVAQLYEQIVKDLTEAESLLNGYSRSAKYKIDANVVKGLLARTYLALGKWDEAAQKAAEAREGYSLMGAEDYYKGFNDLNNGEWIWGHGQRPDQSVASYNFHFLDVSSASSYYYSFMADPYFKDFFDTNDIRYKLFFWDNLPGREGFLRYEKFKFRADQTGDIVLMRASEMYLIEAEAYAEAGKLDKAVEALNALRSVRKAQLFDLTGKTKEDVVNAVLIERRKELWGEGFALADILRKQRSVERKLYKDANGKDIQVTLTLPDGSQKTVTAKGHRVVKFADGTNFVPNSKYYIFAIPQNEVRDNPNLNN